MSLPLETADADRNSSLAAAVDAAITSALDDKRLVGTVVLVARDGEIVHHRAAGLADRESGLPMREDTIFRLASITKPIVTIAAMRGLLLQEVLTSTAHSEDAVALLLRMSKGRSAPRTRPGAGG